MTIPLFTPTQIFDFIKKYEPFNQMSDACLWKVAKLLDVEAHAGDTLLIKKGEKLNDLYILIKGRLYFKVTNAEGKVTYQGEFNEGAVIGEMALLSNQERSADVYTLRDSIILKLSQGNFLDISRRYPELMNKIIQFTIKRLTNSMQGINSNAIHNKSIAIIPIRPMPDFEAQLVEITNKHAYGEKILVLSSASVLQEKRFLNPDGSISHDGILWINQLEEEYTFIFYLADPTVTVWTKFCIRQADSLAFIAEAEQKNFERSEVEHFVQENQRHFIKQAILLLIHNTSERPNNTAQWLKKRSPASHYHIRYNMESGRARLMRILTDKTIALVLSGGGARGLAHIGLIQLLEERDIPIDCIAGTSMGALLSSGFAMGYSTEEVLNIIGLRLARSARIDFTFPYISIASGKRITQALKEIYGEQLQIEDLWLNYFCVSTDLTSQGLHIHNKGTIWEAIRSSISLPFIYPPVSMDNKLLLDGGILNNIPIDIMRQYSHSSIVMASNISDHSVLKHSSLPSALSGWKLLYNKFRGKTSGLPLNIGELVLRLLTISSHQNTERMMAMADLGISLHIEQYGMLDFKRFNEIAHIGYQQAKEQLKVNTIQELLALKNK